MLDRRDYSYHRTFPRLGAAAPAELPPMTYNHDAGLTMPDQMADGYPNGCTGYTQTDCKTDETRAIYSAPFTYKKTCFMDGQSDTEPCDIRTSCKSLRVYGALHKNKPLHIEDKYYESLTEEQKAALNKSGKSFVVEKLPGRDWFDTMRITLRSSNKNSISIGTIWFPEWGSWLTGGELTAAVYYSGDPYAYGWHNYKLCGEETLNGKPVLLLKSWQGKRVGVDGWLKIGREAFNKAFDMYGTLAIIQAEADPNDIKLIKLDILQTVLVFLNRILLIIGRQIPVHA